MVRFVALLLLSTGAVWGAEQAVLHTGFRIAADRHELDGGVVRLYRGTGVIEFPASSIAAFEQIEEFPEPVAPDPPPANLPEPKPPRDPRTIVDEAAARHGLPRELVHSVARVESGYRVDALSPKGAIGVMQLMPGTAALLQADPHDPEQNIEAGARHLRDLLIQYNGDTAKALAAYNAGAGAVNRYNGVPPYTETVTYVEKVLRNYWRLAGLKKAAEASPRGVSAPQAGSLAERR